MSPRAGRSTRPAVDLRHEDPRPEAAPLTAGVFPVAKPFDDFKTRLALRLDEVARALGVSRRALERERSAGRLPRPDLTIGRMPLWTPETIRAWIAEGGRT
jgi:predicted DNA-binding transcriptional regulator AlpA